ncbi:MAG: class I SAM-dependent methyltransferase [Armatimonadetes bacterium]|nr:class I SAM-dependent methyltransferase [Armatimonadota bacterium]
MEVLVDAQSVMQRFEDLLACACGGPFEIDLSASEAHCSECSRRYRFADGVFAPVVDEPERAEGHDVQLDEERCRDRQAKFYDAGIAVSLSSGVEASKIRKALSSQPFDRVIEIGCGTGRFTVDLARRANRVVAVDRSVGSLQVCRGKLQEAGLADRVLLVHSDVLQLPVKPRAFDLALMAQVLQHLPSASLRSQALESIAQTLEPGGRFILSAYEWRRIHPYLIHKEGFHRGGIYYRRFTRDELRALLSEQFDVVSIESCLGKLLLAQVSR